MHIVFVLMQLMMDLLHYIRYIHTWNRWIFVACIRKGFFLVEKEWKASDGIVEVARMGFLLSYV